MKPHPLANAKKKYSRHRAQSKFRNIEFKFTFEEWYDWWLSHGIDRNIDVKWPGKDRPCMCRKNDQGAYEQSNVYFGTHVDNNAEMHAAGNHGYRPLTDAQVKKMYDHKSYNYYHYNGKDYATLKDLHASGDTKYKNFNTIATKVKNGELGVVKKRGIIGMTLEQFRETKPCKK